LNDCELNTSTVAAKPRANKEKQTFRVKNIEKYNIVRQIIALVQVTLEK
jgi:hypothetical protein